MNRLFFLVLMSGIGWAQTKATVVSCSDTRGRSVEAVNGVCDFGDVVMCFTFKDQKMPDSCPVKAEKEAPPKLTISTLQAGTEFIYRELGPGGSGGTGEDVPAVNRVIRAAFDGDCGFNLCGPSGDYIKKGDEITHGEEWTCVDKNRILMHDEQTSPFYWCHRPRP